MHNLAVNCAMAAGWMDDPRYRNDVLWLCRFHANAWGLTYAAPLVGAKLVLPGKDGKPAVLQI